MKFTDRLSHAWNAFVAKEKNPKEQYEWYKSSGMTSSSRLDRVPLRVGTERSILASIYTRIAIDVAQIEVRHARVDQNGRFLEEIPSSLNDCLAISANKDQTARAFFMDVVLSMFDEGTVAIVPIDTTIDIAKTNSYDIQSIRCGRITQWMPDYVRVDVYNDKKGIKEELLFPKSKCCIIENPLYQVMNEPNSTLQRLKHKLALLDLTDDKQNSEKLNMIIQLPYSVKGESQMHRAEERRKQVEMQLTDSKYGIAYIDGTEKIIQLGHPLENRLVEQVEYFTNQLYAQLGLTPEVFNGTADPQVMLNYTNRTLEPIISAIVDEMHRKLLTKTARTQGQAIMFFRAPFSLVTIDNLAEMAERFTRNEILNSNEIRAILGYKPVDTPRADELLNKNINPIADDPMYLNPAITNAQAQEMGIMPGQSGPPVEQSGPPTEQAGPPTEQAGPPEEQMPEQNPSNNTKSKQEITKELEGYLDQLNSLESDLDSVKDKQAIPSDSKLKDTSKMTKKEMQEYLKKLEAFEAELDELESQAGGVR